MLSAWFSRDAPAERVMSAPLARRD